MTKSYDAANLTQSERAKEDIKVNIVAIRMTRNNRSTEKERMSRNMSALYKTRMSRKMGQVVTMRGVSIIH